MVALVMHSRYSRDIVSAALKDFDLIQIFSIHFLPLGDDESLNPASGPLRNPTLPARLVIRFDWIKIVFLKYVCMLCTSSYVESFQTEMQFYFKGPGRICFEPDGSYCMGHWLPGLQNGGSYLGASRLPGLWGSSSCCFFRNVPGRLTVCI